MWRLFALVLAVWLPACKVLDTPIARDAPIHPGSAYVYGTFAYETDAYATGNIALWLKGIELSKGNNCYVPLSTDGYSSVPRVSAYRMEPGVYEFGDVAFLTGTVFSGIGRLPYGARLELQRNKAYYLGDYAGELRSFYLSQRDRERYSKALARSTNQLSRETSRFYWMITSMEDNFDGATLAVQKDVPGFREIDKVNLVPQIRR